MSTKKTERAHAAFDKMMTYSKEDLVCMIAATTYQLAQANGVEISQEKALELSAMILSATVDLDPDWSLRKPFIPGS